jgi:hypothetical protein
MMPAPIVSRADARPGPAGDGNARLDPARTRATQKRREPSQLRIAHDETRSYLRAFAR